MSNVANLAEEMIRRPRNDLEEGANNVFRVLHGFYGNLFLSRFSTGLIDGQGNDAGVVSARQIWGHGLRSFDSDNVKTALAQCLTRHPEYPPSLPQFVGMCEAARPRLSTADEHPEFKAIGIGQKLRSQYARQAREINARHGEKALQRETGYMPLPPGLDGLKRAIANAVGNAGGNEAETLLGLDRMFAKEVA